MQKMLKISKEAHKIIKSRASLHEMTIIDYVDYVVAEEKNSEKFSFVDVEKFNNETLIAMGGDIVIELQKRGLNISYISLKIIESNTIKE